MHLVMHIIHDSINTITVTCPVFLSSLMIWNESTIILAIVGMVGLFACATVYQRANRITSKYYSTKINKDLIELNNEVFK